MTVVVDVGCVTRGDADSIGYLIDRFQPTILYGFDPEADDGVTEIDGVTVVQRAEAAWVEDGFVGWNPDGSRSRVVPDMETAGTVAAFDFAAWIRAHASSDDLVVKLDIEGGEYELVADLIATGTDQAISLLLVEWHPVNDRWERERDRLVERVGCPVEEWPL